MIILSNDNFCHKFLCVLPPPPLSSIPLSAPVINTNKLFNMYQVEDLGSGQMAKHISKKKAMALFILSNLKTINEKHFIKHL